MYIHMLTAVCQLPIIRYMSPYVDGYVIALKKKHVDEYIEMATRASLIWMDHGALDYKECLGEDLTPDEVKYPFPLPYKLKNDETLIFAYVLFHSRAHRDEVNRAVMRDPRMKAEMEREMPFDFKRFSYGGFEVCVDAKGSIQ